MDVLMLNHTNERCGVYQFWKRMYEVLKHSTKLDIGYIEVSGWLETSKALASINPKIAFFNYHWGVTEFFNNPQLSIFPCKRLAFMHDVDKNSVVNLPTEVFSKYVTIDQEIDFPQKAFTAYPLLQDFTPEEVVNDKVTIGTVAFAFAHKGFESLVRKVESEYDEAVLRVHVPTHFSGSSIENLRHLLKISKPGVVLEVSTDFVSNDELLVKLSKNDINIFYYGNFGDANIGTSSALDNAIMARRPVAAYTECKMFRNYKDIYDKISFEGNSIQTLIDNGIDVFKPYYEKWGNASFTAKYEEIFFNVLGG